MYRDANDELRNRLHVLLNAAYLAVAVEEERETWLGMVCRVANEMLPSIPEDLRTDLHNLASLARSWFVDREPGLLVGLEQTARQIKMRMKQPR